MSLALVGDAAYVTVGVANSLRETEQRLDDATEAFEEGDIELVRELLTVAGERANEAANLIDHPSFVLASSLPWLGSDPRALEALVDAARLSARAGLSAADAAEAMGVSGDELASAVYEDGVIRFDALDAGAPHVSIIEELLTDAVESLEDAPAPHLDLLHDALETAHSKVARAQGAAHKGRVLFASLPSLFGEDGERRYMLAFQALGEARATGGLIGQYGILSAEDGRLTLKKVASVKEVFPTKFPPVEAPKWFEKNYGPQSALKQIQQVNTSPNFPTVSEVALRMYESLTDERLDGMIAMDPVALSEMMRGTGPIESPELGAQVTAENAVDVVMRRSYLEFDEAGQDEFLAALVGRFWKKIRDGDLDAATFVDGLNEAARTQHIKVYSRDPDDQAAMVDIAVDGGYGVKADNIQLVFHNNYGPNKVDFFLRRSIDTLVQLTSEGGARFTTTITLENQAPPGPSSLLLGQFPERAPPGTNRMTLNVLMPRGARVISYTVDGEDLFPLRFQDERHPVAWQLFDIPAEETKVATIVYEIFDVAQFSADGGILDLSFVPQTTIEPDNFSLTVVPPPGFEVRRAGDSSAPPKGKFEDAGQLASKRSYSVEVISTGD